MSSKEAFDLDAVEKRNAGRERRTALPRKAHANWLVTPNRERPLELLRSQAANRLSYLLPERYTRMSVSPFAFFRGAALVMAADLAETPATGMMVQLCGDAHIANFGGYASFDRRLVFDINDFDETFVGPWEWDIKRLAASIAVCGRDRGFKSQWTKDTVAAAAGAYRKAMHTFSQMGTLALWNQRLDILEILEPLSPCMSKKEKQETRKKLEKAHGKTSASAYQKLIQVQDGKESIAFNPPFLVPLNQFSPAESAEKIQEELFAFLKKYRESLSPERKTLFDQYRYIDAAQKVVGVGSVGTRAWIVAFRGSIKNDVLILQIKEAQASVLENFAGKMPYASNGERIVSGQRLMQASSDILLGYASSHDIKGKNHDYYVRQLWDWKTSADLESATAAEIALTAKLCAWALAKAHARTGNRFEISGYLGQSSSFDVAMVEFARAYADQNEADYQKFTDALSRGLFDSAGAVK